jgi:Inosine-uridine nucleoside N-ribohydrolase
MEKLLYDTDIGSDIDDAVCLAYLLSQPECDLLGITTVSGEPEKRAMIASAICTAAGRDVPIIPGAPAPLLIDQKQAAATQAKALGRWKHRADFPSAEAVPFMRDVIRRNPGEVTLLATGPMTNVALLFAQDPEIPSLLKQLVLMCGVFTTGTPGVDRTEWNAVCDPHAAAAVYRAPVAVHRSVGLDVTMRVRMPRERVAETFTADILKPVFDFAGVWFEHADQITFHDPLAAVSIFDESVCGFQKGTVEVELTGTHSFGMTCWKPDAGGRHEVALDVDADGFFRHYFSIVK